MIGGQHQQPMTATKQPTPQQPQMNPQMIMQQQQPQQVSNQQMGMPGTISMQPGGQMQQVQAPNQPPGMAHIQPKNVNINAPNMAFNQPGVGVQSVVVNSNVGNVGIGAPNQIPQQGNPQIVQQQQPPTQQLQPTQAQSTPQQQPQYVQGQPPGQAVPMPTPDDEAYTRKIQDLRQYLPILDVMLSNASEKSQTAKIKAFIDVVMGNKRVTMETLLKCEKTLIVSFLYIYI